MLWLWTVLSGVVVFVVTLWVTYKIYNIQVLRLCSAIPSAQPCYPLLGNILTFACSLEKITEKVIQVVEESVLSGHRAVCFWLGFYPIIFITDPSDIKKVLNNSLSRVRQIEESSKDYMKYGLITSPVDHWKLTRRHLNLSFHPKNLEELMPTFNSTSRQLVSDLSAHVDGATFDLLPHVMSAALKSIYILIYGPAAMEHVSSDHFEHLRHAVAGELMALRVTRPWLLNDFLFKIFYGKEIDYVKTAYYRTFKTAKIPSVGLIELKEGCVKEDAGQGKAESGFHTILDAMLGLQAKSTYLTDQHIQEEMIGFFVGGTDSIGASVSSCLLALACYPHIQKKVYEEICSEASEEEDITSADLNRLTYLHQVIKETFRFFKIIPLTVRTPNKEVDLGGYSIPANKLTILCISAAAINPIYFPDPHKFDPDRFASSTGFDASVFMPFSRGPRNCIAKEYAIMLMKVMVAQVVRKYALSTDMDIMNLKKRYITVLTSSEGYNVYLNKRSK